MTVDGLKVANVNLGVSILQNLVMSKESENYQGSTPAVHKERVDCLQFGPPYKLVSEYISFDVQLPTLHNACLHQTLVLKSRQNITLSESRLKNT